MLDLFYEAFIHIFAVSLIAAVSALFAVAGQRAKVAGLAPHVMRRTVFCLGVLLATWFALGVMFARAGVMTWAPANFAPPMLAIVLALMPVLLLALIAGIRSLRRIAGHLDQAGLIGLQGFRVMAWVFLIGWAGGGIPAVFAIPAALGDIWAGIEGLRAARKVRRGAADAERAVLRANIIGLADFGVAASLGLVTIEGAFNILSPDAPSIVGNYPLVLVPVLFVPLFITLHVLSLQRLRRDAGWPAADERNAEPAHHAVR